MLSAGIVAMVALLIMGECGVFREIGVSSFSEFLRGFQTGILFSVSIVFAVLNIRYIRLLRNDEKLKAAYYTENDERNRLIMMKIGGSAMYVCTVIILLAGIVAGYFNETVFFSLTGCAMFILIARGILKVYYTTKY